MSAMLRRRLPCWLALLLVTSPWLLCVGIGGAAASAQVRAVAPPVDSFRLSDEQLRGIGIAQVKMAPFHSEILTDGKIVFDGDRLTSVYSPFSGRVSEVLVPLGAAVRRGQPLFWLDASEYAQAASDLLSAQAQLQLNIHNEERKHLSYEAHGAALQDWQQSQSELAASQAALAAVRNRLRILGQSDAQIDAMVAGGRPASRIAAVAPLSGWVVDRQIGPGQYLQAGASTPVYTIADLSKVWLLANVRETEVAAVHIGQPVTVRVAALPQREFGARLTFVAATIDPQVRRIAVHAVIDNADRVLKPEMLAEARIRTSEDVQAPAVPEAAVIYEGDQARVWVMRNAHDAALRLVRLGRSSAGQIEVLQGLSAGERVITRGALFIDRAGGGD